MNEYAPRSPGKYASTMHHAGMDVQTRTCNAFSEYDIMPEIKTCFFSFQLSTGLEDEFVLGSPLDTVVGLTLDSVPGFALDSALVSCSNKMRRYK